MEPAAALIRSFPKRRILVIGDVMLDEYLWGHIQRISPEAPVPILSIERREYSLGGAGNVAANIRSLGGQVNCVTVIGEDEVGALILRKLEELGARQRIIRDCDRKSSCKTRLMSVEHGQQVFRFDEESTHSLPAGIEDALLEALESEIADADAILCSDYRKGVLTERVLQAAIRLGREKNLPVLVAPKDSNAHKYRGANVLMPNLKEFAQLAGVTDNGSEWLDETAARTIAQLEIDSLVITRGSMGISLFERAGKSVRRTDVPTVARTVYDVTGAGDTFASMFILALTAGANYEFAARLANLSAGIVVGKRGTASVTIDEIQERLAQEETILSHERHAP